MLTVVAVVTVAFANFSVAAGVAVVAVVSVAAIVVVVAVVANIGHCPDVVCTETSLRLRNVRLDNTYDTFAGAHRTSIAFNLDVNDWRDR